MAGWGRLAGCSLPDWLLGSLASWLLAAGGWLAGLLVASLAGCWLLTGWLAAGRLVSWLLAGSGWLAGWLAEKNGPLSKIEVIWESQLHCHLMLILSQNQTSIHEEYFACGIFSFQRSFVNEEHIKGAHVIRSRGALGTGSTYGDER